MRLPFLQNAAATKRHDQILAVDLGSRITKAVHLQRRGNGFALLRYALLDAPIYEKAISADLLCEHLKAVNKLFEGKVKPVALTLGVNDVLVRHVDLPQMPMEDMRQVLKLNSKTYLQQDLTGHVFDCYATSPPDPGKKPASAKGAGQKKILIAGAKKQMVDDFAGAIRNAGFTPDHILPAILGPINAFEHAMPKAFSEDVVALVDIGFTSTTISLLQDGELILNRVVAIGGDRMTTGLAEAMNISYPEAESIKIGIAQEVETVLDALLMPLGRDLRASIDFFEHQQDRTISQVYVSGGSARSDYIIQTLRRELLVDCTPWNPAATLQLVLSPEQTAEIQQIAPQLVVAIGAGLTAL